MSFWKKKEEQPEISTPVTQTAPTSAPSTPPAKAASPDKAAAPSPVSPSPIPQVAKEASASPDEDLQERFGKIRSALGPGTVIQGKLSFDTPVRIDGKLSGEIFSSKALIVGSAGTVEAQIEASVLVVQGTVRGNVTASERIELAKGGRLEGDVRTPVFVVEEGAIFSGGCSMGGRASATPVKNDTTKGEGKPSSPKVTVPVVTVADQSKATPGGKETSSKESPISGKDTIAGKDTVPGKEATPLH